MQSQASRPIEAASSFFKTRGHLVVLAGLVGLSLFFRLWGIDWDQGGLYHPDERAILFHVNDLSFPKGDLGSLFSTGSSWNPAWFPYGSLPLYLLKVVGYIAPPFLENPSLVELSIMGRAMSAIADTITVVLIYVVASRLFGRWAGLLGASFIALSALHIQQSHFFVTDIQLGMMLMASFFFLTRAMDEGRLRQFALAGLFYGLAMGTKFSAAPFALVIVAAGLLWVFKSSRRDVWAAFIGGAALIGLSVAMTGFGSRAVLFGAGLLALLGGAALALQQLRSDEALRQRLMHGAQAVLLAGAVALATRFVVAP
ncbi:MAG: glycosyltransferase family 39 protein [Chloroflexi bacterium]|nr:glycosyltransferase family 39 protein [Chloroflexota bacterium]